MKNCLNVDRMVEDKLDAFTIDHMNLFKERAYNKPML